MSNDIKSQSQATPPGLCSSLELNLAHPRPQERGFRTGDASDLHGHPALPFRTMPPGPKTADPSGLKMQGKRPFLTESAPQAEFDLSYTKQRTEKFLTE